MRVKERNHKSLIWCINKNGTYKRNKDSDLGNLNRELKKKEEGMGKSEARLREIKRVNMAETRCINSQIFCLIHVINPLFVISSYKK